jgi:hypothetical protein
VVCIAFLSENVSSTGRRDTLCSAEKENLRIESVVFDTLTYQKFKRQTFYHYEEKIENPSLWQKLYEKFNRWLFKNLNKTMSREDFNRLLWGIGLIVIAGVAVTLYFHGPGIFYRNKKNRTSYTVDYEDIENQDVDRLIEQLLHQKQYPDAIRWQYLKTLKILHEKGLISYDAFKTVNEYASEIKDTGLRLDFKKLSHQFVWHRYGKREANADQFGDFRKASEELIKVCSQ